MKRFLVQATLLLVCVGCATKPTPEIVVTDGREITIALVGSPADGRPTSFEVEGLDPVQLESLVKARLTPEVA